MKRIGRKHGAAEMLAQVGRAESKAAEGGHLLPVWYASDATSGAERLFEELEELRYTVERTRLSEKGDVPAIMGVAAVTRPDGASSVCRSLATVLAFDPDPTVCFVDLNRWSWDIGSEDRSGVMDVIHGNATLEDALVSTAHPRLQYLPYGRFDEDRPSFVRRDRGLGRILEQLAESFTYVVLELPPLLATSEALAIASYCQACVVVAQHGATTRRELRDALDSLGEVRVLGVVLDRVEFKMPRFLLRLLTE
jgi:Mrp family chromosome partitioning ATPase